MAKIAQGQLTIVDLYDMPPVQARLSSNMAKIFIEGKDGTITPQLSEGNALIVDAEVYQAGSSTNIAQTPTPTLGTINSIQWTFVMGDKVYSWENPTDNAVLVGLGIKVVSPGGVPNRTVQITKNDALKPTLKIQATAMYRYTGMSEVTNVGMDIDFATIYSGVDGEDAFTVFLTNTSHIFPVNPVTGEMTPGVSVETKAEAYQGIKKLTNVKIAKDPSFTDLRFDITTPGNVDVAKITTLSGVRVYGTSDTDQGTIPFQITVPGVTTPFNSNFSWAVSSKGVDGQSPSSYWLVISDPVIIKSFKTDGSINMSPSSIKISAMTQTGEAAPTSWSSGVIKVYKNGSTTGSTITNGSSYTVTQDTTELKFELLNGATVVDSETVRVIQQQKEPVVMAVQANSDTIRNNEGSVTLEVIVYKNGVNVTSSVSKKWYKSTGTQPVGTGNTLIVNAGDVTSSELFRCDVEVEGTTYSDSITVWDVSDPIAVEMRSSGGDKFQNGSGSSILECILWRNGAEIDVDGSIYVYTWKKLGADGKPADFEAVKEPTTATTFKRIKVTNQNVDKKATFICEVSEKVQS